MMNLNARKFIEIVCECDIQTDGRTYNNVIIRYTARMMAVISIFTNLGDNWTLLTLVYGKALHTADVYS